MSYEPTVWNVGDTIAVAKLNKLEQGVAEMSSGYTPTVWVDGDEITAQKMNRLEQAVANSGSSDFGTAQMTVNDSVDHIMYGAFAVGIVGPDDPPPTTTGKVYTDEYDSFSVVMYKGMAAVEFEIDEQTTISATGSATVDRNYVIITGDCNITIS